MQNNLIQVFESGEFGQLGVLIINGKPYFPATECALALGYKNPRDAVIRHCLSDGVVKHDGVSFTTNQHGVSTQQTVEKTYISEGNLYRLIVRSKLPSAIRFEKWAMEEVLPTIRKHGAYINEDVLLRMQEDSEYNAELLRNLTAERKKAAALYGKVTLLTPKARYHDIILQCPDAVQVSIIAKDYSMSATAFNKLLYKLGVQFRIGKTWLLYKKHQGNGYTITNTYTKNGMTTIIHTCWTQRGRYWLYELLKSHGILPEAETMASGEQMSLADVFADANINAVCNLGTSAGAL